jgi:hypothetical protein
MAGDNIERSIETLIEHLREGVLAELRRSGERPSPAEAAAMARDYRSWQRMGHPPARALRVAERVLFQQRIYLDTGDPRRHDLAVRITGLLAEVHEAAAGGPDPQSGQ